MYRPAVRIPKELKWIRVSMKWIWGWISENYCWYIVVINGGPIAPTPNTTQQWWLAAAELLQRRWVAVGRMEWSI